MPKTWKQRRRAKPWCERATPSQDNLEIQETDTWKKSNLLFYGRLLQALGSGLSVILIIISLTFAGYIVMTSKGDGYEARFWETAASGMTLLWYTMAMLVIGVFMIARSKANAKRLLYRARCQICPKCLYDLSARPRNNDTCPECGMNAPRRECVRLWCKLLRSRF